jgi:hypothetical protein
MPIKHKTKKIVQNKELNNIASKRSLRNSVHKIIVPLMLLVNYPMILSQ